LRERPLPAAFPPAQVELAAFAERWTLQLAPGPGRARLVQVTPGMIEFRGAPTAAAQRRLLRAWLKARVTLQLGLLLESLARETGLGFRRLAVRRQRTRWGSCSARGTISLNACLAFQRPAVVRYLLLHELAHTQHMNHSSRFWRLVARHEPDWRALDRELIAGWRNVPAWMFEDGD
jgi:predicted metal-dependent hydrolase